MASRDEMIAFLDELLMPGGFSDYCPNGLQVPGAGQVDVVATGVSAHLELFERAAEAGAQMVLCHHGIFWSSQPRSINPTMRRRLEALFHADMSLAAYHLPLDAHPEVGNNALICSELGLERAEPFGHRDGKAIGWVGRTVEGVPIAELRERCEATFGGRPPLVFEGGPEVVHSVGLVSGGGGSHLADAAALGLDAFLTGEPEEPAMADASEAGVHFIAAGHYATETFGVKRLGEILRERFDVEHRFIDIPNPV